METKLLSDQSIPPTKEVIENALGESSSAYNELIEVVTDVKLGLVTEWRYYKDGKAWLCKVCYKKKTIFWLSVWDKFFKISFYFTLKNCPGIAELDIDQNIKEEFSRSTTVGKLIPLVIRMYRREQIDDVIKIIEYKKRLK
ncbi:MAG: DUF3788 domain-containing protein [Bacteroidales bacterium]|nr:DUF3788 domain-containing protein [Bacteroidales bacterium]